MTRPYRWPLRLRLLHWLRLPYCGVLHNLRAHYLWRYWDNHFAVQVQTFEWLPFDEQYELLALRNLYRRPVVTCTGGVVTVIAGEGSVINIDLSATAAIPTEITGIGNVRPS